MASALAPAGPVHPAVARRRGRRRTTRAPASSSASAQVETDADVIANHERILGIRDAPKDTVLMFSYGANINPYTLNRRGIGPTASAVARAPGRRLVFVHRGGYASLEEAVDEDAKDAGSANARAARSGPCTAYPRRSSPRCAGGRSDTR